MDKIKNTNNISSYQVVLLITVYRSIIAFTYLPVINTPPANQDIWVALLLSIPYTTLLCLPILYLSNKFKDLTIVEYTEKILGRVFGKIAGIYYTAYMLLFTIILVGTLVEILNSTMFPETPTWATALLMLITSSYIAFKGLEPIARGSEIFAPFIFGVVFLFIILGYKNYDLHVLFPILRDSTFKEINIGAIDRGIKFSDIIILAMITPHLEKKEDLNKVFIKSVVYSTIIIIFVALSTQLSLGIEYAKHANFPFFTFTRLINLFDFIQRIDALFVVAWIAGNIGKISGYLYFTTVAFTQTVRKGKNQAYIIPIAIIVLIITIWIKDRRSILGVSEPLTSIILATSLLTIFVLPLITVIVYFIRRKSLSNKGNN